MPADPVDQLRALGNSFDELVPPVTMDDLRGRPSSTGRGRLAVRIFAAAAAVVTLVAVGAIVLRRGDGEVEPTDSAPTTTAKAGDEIAAALAAWEASGPSDYQLSLSAEGTTISLGPTECEFAVRGDGVTLVRGPIRVDRATGTRTIDSYLGFCSSFVPNTIEGLLQLIAEHRADGHDVPAKFDDTGVPFEFTLDAEMDETDGATWYRVTVAEPLELPTVTLTADDHLVCGPIGGGVVVASVTYDLAGLTVRVVIDELVILTSEPTQSAGTADILIDPRKIRSDVPDPRGKIGELQVIDADGYVLATQPFTMALASGTGCF